MRTPSSTEDQKKVTAAEYMITWLDISFNNQNLPPPLFHSSFLVSAVTLICKNL